MENTTNTNTVNEKNATPTKVIFKSYIARGLLRRNHKMVDIKPYRDNPERTVYVFEDSLRLRDDVKAITHEYEQKKAKGNTENVVNG